MDKNTADYRAGITWDGNTDSCYIFLWDSTENGWKREMLKIQRIVILFILNQNWAKA